MGTDPKNPGIKKLAIYDFDGTLFRSPETPDWWGSDSWHGDLRSLDPVTIGLMPSDMTWVEPVAEKAFHDCLSSTTYTILATGRKDKIFRKRIEDMVAKKGLVFDEIHLNPDMHTSQYKVTTFFNIFYRIPGIEIVEFWEDQETLLRAYLDIFQAFPVKVFGHLIKAKPVIFDLSREAFFAARVANTYLESKIFL